MDFESTVYVLFSLSILFFVFAVVLVTPLLLKERKEILKYQKKKERKDR